MSVWERDPIAFLREARLAGVKSLSLPGLVVEFFEDHSIYPENKAGILDGSDRIKTEKDLSQLAIDDPAQYEAEIIDRQVF